MAGAFQQDAFQNDAFQVEAAVSGVTLYLAATDGADSADGGLSLNLAITLAATDGADSAATVADLAPGFSMAATDGADSAAAALDAIPAGAVDLSLDATDGADSCSAVMDGGQADNQPLRIYNLKRRKKRRHEVVPEGRWDITVSGPQADEVSPDETVAVEPVEVAPLRDHSRWITVLALKPLRVKVKTPAPIESEDEHVRRLLLLLAS